MSAVSGSTEKAAVPAQSFCVRHQKSIGYSLLILGVAAAAITIGVIAGTSACSQYEPYGNGYNDIPRDMSTDYSFTGALEDTSQANFYLGFSVGSGGGIASLLLIGFGSGMVVKARKDLTKESDDAGGSKVTAVDVTEIAADRRKKRLKIALMCASFVVAFFAVGLICASATMLNHAVPGMKELIAKGRELYPNDGEYFDKLQTKWMDITEPNMIAVASVASIALAASGGLFIFLGGHEMLKKLYHSFKKTDQIIADERNTPGAN